MSYPHYSTECNEHHDLVVDFGGRRPFIVCLCGSTKFWEKFRDYGLKFTLEGKIVLSIGTHSPDSITFANSSTEEGKKIKQMLDELHKRKIDLCDAIFVLNVGGYIGESTKSEIEYAKKISKAIFYLEESLDERPKEN